MDRAAKMDATLAYLRVHFRDPLTAADLAAQAGVSVKHYMDLFRKRYGRSLGQELTRLRIEAASDRLAMGHGRLKDIAAEVGYEDEFYFSRRFKQETGVTPTAFMRSRSRPIAALDASFIGLLTPLHYLPRAAPIHPIWRSYYSEKFGNRVRLQLKIDRDAAAQADNVELLLAEPVDYSAFLCPSDFDATLRRQLEKRGPVWVLDRDFPWRVQLRTLATWLEAEQEAERWLDEYERLVEEAAKRIATQNPGSFLCLLLEEDRLYICEDRSLSEVFYGDLGLPSAKRLMDQERQLVTPAQLAELDPAHLLMLIYEDAPTMSAWQQLQQDEQWAELRAVRSKKIHAISSFPWRDYSALPHRLIVEDAVVLGVQPYASSAIGDEADPFPGFYSPLGDTAIPLFGSGSDSMEYLLSLAPDLIIATDMEEAAVIEQLGLIVPTIQVSHFGTDWEANLNLLAELTGKQSEAQQAIERYEEGKKRLTASLASYEGQDILAIRVRGGEMMVYPEDVFLNDVLYGELSLPVPALIQRTSEQQPIGLEGLYAENPDYIFLQYDVYENNESNATLDKLQESNVWKGLKAVQNGHVFINAVDPLVSGGTAYGKQEILSAVEDKLGTP